MNTSVQQECIELIKSERKDFCFFHLQKMKDHETLKTGVMAEN